MRPIKLLAASLLATIGRLLASDAEFTAALSERLTRTALRLREEATRG